MPAYIKRLFLIAGITLLSTGLSAANSLVTRVGPAYVTSCLLMICSVEEVVGIVIGSRQYGVPNKIEGAQVRGDGRCEAGPGALMETGVIVKSKSGEISYRAPSVYAFKCHTN